MATIFVDMRDFQKREFGQVQTAVVPSDENGHSGETSSENILFFFLGNSQGGVSMFECKALHFWDFFEIALLLRLFGRRASPFICSWCCVVFSSSNWVLGYCIPMSVGHRCFSGMKSNLKSPWCHGRWSGEDEAEVTCPQLVNHWRRPLQISALGRWFLPLLMFIDVNLRRFYQIRHSRLNSAFLDYF